MPHKSHDPNDVNDADLECLIMWPAGSVGEAQEREIIRHLNTLCKRFGYGRIPQLAQQIEEVWRDPKKIERFAQHKQQHLEFMAACARGEASRDPLEGDHDQPDTPWGD